MTRVLVVDDEYPLLLSISQILIGAGYEVLSAESVPQALSVLGSQAVDVVLSDLVMPGQDGLVFLSEMRVQHPDIPVIMMTGHSTLQPAIQAMREGALNYLIKPVGKRQLLDGVQEGIQVHEERIKKRKMMEQIIANLQALDPHALTVESVFQRRPTPHTENVVLSDRFLQIRELIIDRHRLVALFRGEVLELTPTEFEILYCLMQANGRVVTFEEIAHHLRGVAIERDEARTMLSSHFANLRAKLTEANCANYLMNSRANGYFINAEPDE